MSEYPRPGTAAAGILQHIEENPGVKIREIARDLGMHGRKADRLVKELVDRRIVCAHTNDKGSLVLSSWEHEDAQW